MTLKNNEKFDFKYFEVQNLFENLINKEICYEILTTCGTFSATQRF